jgi:hypothetical protein
VSICKPPWEAGSGKLEAIRRDGQVGRFFAFTGGVEYTFVGLFDSKADVGLLGEYLYDQRGKHATTPFASDVFVGCRFVLNDMVSTEVLAGVILDYKTGTGNFLVEASRRLRKNWQLIIEARGLGGSSPNELLYSFRRDSFVQLEIRRYF